MKTTVNTKEFSGLLESNGLEDTLWTLESFNDDLSDSQKVDLRLLACDFAERCLYVFESEYPDDKRPRLAIEAAVKYAKVEITSKELELARAAAWAASARAARATGEAARAERAAVWAAARAVAWVAWAVATATREAEQDWQTEQLRALFLKWEQ